EDPSAGLDPLSSRLLDNLILQLRDNLGATVVVVSHELASIFAIGNNSIFLDPETHSIGARGNPTELREHCDNPVVHRFLTRGESQQQPATRGDEMEKAAIVKAAASVRSN